ncbi:MAG TPA: hypothetical protein VG101_08560 [Puia sp.]|jgi:hypothetical protein|nr:hypothetical protein [Puia sp.]
MRKMFSPLLPGVAAVVGALLLLPGCLKDHITESYKVLSPVYELRSTVLAGINGDPGTPVSQPGQIYVKGSYIFLNDAEKGIHVIDNSDPSHPVQTAFLKIPGNLNIGIRNNILYADMYADVLAIDISNIHQVKVVGALRNFFSMRIYNPDTNYVVANWIVKDTSFRVVPRGLALIPHTIFYGYGGPVPGGIDLAYAASSSSTTQSGTGTAGSNAVMTLVGDYLYAIPESHSLGIVHVADSSNPAAISEVFGGYDLETIFPIQDKLLLGSKEGVFAYSISDPTQPTEIGEFTHGTACDPVIANSNYAYVTLHAGTSCGGSANELDILDAQNIAAAFLIRIYPMTSPTGLCLDGSLLFVCDQSVVKVFDATDPGNLKLLSSVPVNSPNDVIAANHVMLVVAADGLYQFDYTDPGNVSRLSYIPANNSKS